MSYLRISTKLPSGALSTSYVYLGGKWLVNMARPAKDFDSIAEDDKREDEEYFLVIPNAELKNILQSQPGKLIDFLQARLDLTLEEAEYVGKRLLNEYQNGEWD